MSFEFLSFITHYMIIIKNNTFQTMKIKAVSWGYYISPPLMLNTVLGVLFIPISLAHSGTWRDMLPTFCPPFPNLPLQGWNASIALLFERWLDSGAYIPSCLECGKVWSGTAGSTWITFQSIMSSIIYIYIYIYSNETWNTSCTFILGGRERW